MILDIRELLAEAVREYPFAYEMTLSDEFFDESPMFRGVTFPLPLKVKGVITNTSGYMTLSLSLCGEYTTDCARCMCEVGRSLDLRLEKPVVPKSMTDGESEEYDDVIVVDDGRLDLYDTITELLYLEFPSKVLCREDCKGMCQRCGKNLNDSPCTCERETDPRLDGLKSILAELRAKEQNEK